MPTLSKRLLTYQLWLAALKSLSRFSSECFGSKADICVAKTMSTLPPIATAFASDSLVAISALFFTFGHRCLNSLCRVVETFAHTSRQLPRVNCHAISRRLWPIQSDHGSAPFD